jgi:hypothetical protein
MRKKWDRIRIRIWIGFKNGKSDPDLEEQFKSGRYRLRYFSLHGYYKVNIYVYIRPSIFCAVQSTVQSERCTYVGTVDDSDCVQNCECRFASQLIKKLCSLLFFVDFQLRFFRCKTYFLFAELWIVPCVSDRNTPAHTLVLYCVF